MFIFKLLLCLLQLEVVSTLPTPQSMDGSCPAQDDSNSNLSTRSTSDIFWSCITTIFACTWVAVHPNLPPSCASDRQLFWRRVKILAVALIGPEFIIIWAVNQLRSTLYGLKKLRAFDACKHWTVAHGMFLVMGGFVLADESGARLEVLQAHKLNKLLSDHLITLPHIPESEIMDRSKGDALAKALVLIQTTWFTTQVISRAVLHLPITELELTTVAFALLNFLTYALWWKKPLDVRHPIVITLRCSPQQAAALDLVPILSASSTDILSSYDIPSTAMLSEVNFADSGYSADNRSSWTASSGTLGEIEPSSENLTLPLHGPHSLWAPPTSEVDITDIKGNQGNHVQSNSDDDTNAESTAVLSSLVQNKLQSRSFVSFSWLKALRTLGGSLRSSVQTCCYKLTSVIARALRNCETIYSEFVAPSARSSIRERLDHRHTRYIDHIPIFYAGATAYGFGDDDDERMLRSFWVAAAPRLLPTILEMFIGALFGSIHCAAWTFHFPSRLEQTLWRTMSLCITVIPMALMIVMVVINLAFQFPICTWLVVRSRLDDIILRPLNYFLVLVYVVARMITLVMAVVLLRDLPDGAFQVVQWTLYIPHV